MVKKMKVNLDNFILEEYDQNNREHREVISHLGKDQGVKKYLGNINYSIEKINFRKNENFHNGAFIPYYNDYPIGYLSLSYIHDEYQISYGILSEFRKQNLASLLLEEFSDYLLSNDLEIDQLILKIEQDNIGSRKVADLAGYTPNSTTKYSRKR